jgi:hypothetical protein
MEGESIYAGEGKLLHSHDGVVTMSRNRTNERRGEKYMFIVIAMITKCLLWRQGVHDRRGVDGGG